MPTCFRPSGADPKGPLTLVWRDWVQVDGRWRPRRRKLKVPVTARSGRAQALALGVKLEREADLKRLGLAPPLAPPLVPHSPHPPLRASVPVASVPSALPLSAAIDRWRADLAGSSPAHIKDSLAVIHAVTAPVKNGTVADLTPGLLLDHLDQLRRQGLSPRTCERARSRARAFARFIHEVLQAVDRNPWIGVRAIASRGTRRAQRHGPDARYERRPLTEPEISRLLAAVQDPHADAWLSYRPSPSKPNRKRRKDSAGPITLTPRDRLLIYRLALEAGLRFGDVKGLCPEHILPAPPEAPHVGPSLLLVKSKSQNPTILPVNPALARDLAHLAADRPIGRPIWRLDDSLASAVRFDLAAARPPIPAHHPDDPAPGTPEARAHWKSGRPIRDVVDYHALRHTFVMRGALNPALTPRELQGLARHASITTTMGVYARLPDPRLRAALDHLAPLPSASAGSA